MLFDKIFKAVLPDNAKNPEKLNPKEDVSVSTPKGSYVQTKSNIQPMSDKDYDYLVLYWISKKKNGYDLSSNKFPKWFANIYGIDFNQVARRFIEGKKCLPFCHSSWIVRGTSKWQKSG